ncbi:DUF6114 domain-containing protein [Catenulispora yoronensis]
MLGGGEMLSLFYVPWKVVLHMGLYGISGYLVPILLIILGLSLIFDPAHRTFYSILSLLFSVASWMTSNLGGFMIGMILAMVGASLAFGWSELPEAEQPAAWRYEGEGRGTGADVVATAGMASTAATATMVATETMETMEIPVATAR